MYWIWDRSRTYANSVLQPMARVSLRLSKAPKGISGCWKAFPGRADFSTSCPESENNGGNVSNWKSILLFSVLLIALQSQMVFGQALVGSLQGNVRDGEGQPIPGVGMTLSGEALIG